MVEDDADLRELLCFNLQKAGFAVTTAADGIDALTKAKAVSPSLILLDVMLPEMDGLAVCETLRRQKATARTPIVFLTALSSQMAQFAGYQAGASDYVIKPFSPRELVARLTNWLKEDTQFQEAQAA